jgi:hypothetical protein
MPPDEHVPIISACEIIHIAYPAIFRTLPTITRTYVLADSEVYVPSPWIRRPGNNGSPSGTQ